MLLLIPTGILLLRLPAPVSPLPSAHPTSPVSPSTPLLAPLPELTTYRAHMLLLTALAILAVDFPAFPRALAKCESFGVSLVRDNFCCLSKLLTCADGYGCRVFCLFTRVSICPANSQRPEILTRTAWRKTPENITHIPAYSCSWCDTRPSCQRNRISCTDTLSYQVAPNISLGTRVRVWCSLEFFPYPRIPPNSAGLSSSDYCADVCFLPRRSPGLR